MKVGIVVPYSWSYWGGVVEHAEKQATALRELGVDVHTIIGNDPPGALTKALHPRSGRHDALPEGVTPVGRSVIVPANGSLPNIVLSPPAIVRVRRILREQRFDVIHVHEPMTPAIAVAALSFARCPIVATFHANGDLGWMRYARPMWGFLADRMDARIAVSEYARASAARWLPGDYEIIPNGVRIPPPSELEHRENRVVFIGRQEPRKGLAILLAAWPEVHRRTGARLRLIGADPLAVRLLMARRGLSDEGVDVLGIVDDATRTLELERARVLAAPSLGGESFGMVLTEAFACATPVVASDIQGYRDVMREDTGLLVPPGESGPLGDALVALLLDEPRRAELGAAARRLAEERYAWPDVARRLLSVYDRVTARIPVGA
jgi:phosphatidylinositol alpha-mannosyltransferase